ncbi:MAG: trigger factor [Gemmatimonadales bacterium]|nr:trigger factor [Gemmatimonadales bacterium]
MVENQNTEPQPKPIATTLEAPEPWKRVVKVEISRAHFDKEYATRLKKAVKGHQKQGYRKGKTPKALVEKEMGGVLRMETLEGLVPQAWMVGVLEHKLNPITDPALENLDFPDDGVLKFDLEVEVRPDVSASGYEGIPVKQRAVEVTDAEETEVLERLRESKASFNEVDRPASEGDQLLVDLTPQAWDGEPNTGQTIQDQRLVLGSENNLPAFNEALAEAKAGDSLDISVNYPEDHTNDSLKGQTLVFHCEIKEVAEKAVPELNDEFAADISEGKSLDELKQDIRQDLEKESERRIKVEMDQQIVRELIARNEVSLAPSMVTKYLEAGLEEMHSRNQTMGRAQNEEEDKEYMETGRPHAERSLKGMLLLDSVQKQEEIKVSAEDVDERVKQIAAENGFDVDQYRQFIESGEEKGRLEYDLLDRKTYDFLLSRAEIEPVAADADILMEEEK